MSLPENLVDWMSEGRSHWAGGRVKALLCGQKEESHVMNIDQRSYLTRGFQVSTFSG
jgi:hypothetical protein